MKLFITELHHSFAQVVLQSALLKGWRPRVFSSEAALELPDGVEALAAEPSESLIGIDALVFCDPFASIEARAPLLEEALKAKVPRILFVSSCLLYGQTEERPLDECALDAHPAYDLGVWMERDAPILSVHPVLLFGARLREKDAWLNRFIRRGLEKRGLPPIADGGGAFTAAYADDVAEGLLLALEHGQIGKRYILGGETVSLASFVEALYEVLERKPPRSAPLWRARLYALSEALVGQALKGYKPRNGRQALALTLENRRFSSQRAIAELGYTRTPLKIALHKTLDSLGFKSSSGPELLG